MYALARIFFEARRARREKSKFIRCASEFASASWHLLARILHFRAIFVLERDALAHRRSLAIQDP